MLLVNGFRLELWLVVLHNRLMSSRTLLKNFAEHEGVCIEVLLGYEKQ